jgi:hypothetical protein
MSQTERAKSYLKSRGLSHVGVGYNSGNWTKGKYIEAAQLCGLESWGKNSVVYALRNVLGQVISFYARSLSSKGGTFPTKLGRHYYQSGRAGLYPCYPSK